MGGGKDKIYCFYKSWVNKEETVFNELLSESQCRFKVDSMNTSKLMRNSINYLNCLNNTIIFGENRNLMAITQIILYSSTTHPKSVQIHKRFPDKTNKIEIK